jgi:putative peptidoglycan lipid II flippase
MAVKVLAPGFYAKQDIRTPVRIAVLVLVVTQIMNLALVPWLGHAGLALSIGLGATLNAALLFAGLRRRGDYRPSPGWGRFGLRVLVALGVMGMAVWWIDQRLDWIALQARPWMRPLCLGAAVAAAVVSYFGVLMLLGERLGQLLRRR